MKINIKPLDKAEYRKRKIEYWNRLAESEELELLNKPCEDCAIVCGFYTPHADELLELDLGEEKEDRILKGWFCHNHGNKACRGAYNYVKVKRGEIK